MKTRRDSNGNMMALRAFLAALTPFNSGQLFQFSMQLFDEPTHLILVLNNLCIDRTWCTIDDRPFNVAVRGDHLEKLHFKRNFLEFNGDAILEWFGSPFKVVTKNLPSR